MIVQPLQVPDHKDLNILNSSALELLLSSKSSEILTYFANNPWQIREKVAEEDRLPFKCQSLLVKTSLLMKLVFWNYTHCRL